MQTWILPGYSSKNKSWAESVARKIKIQGQVRPVFWDHWFDPEQKFDIDEKSDLIVKHTKDNKVNMIAKSIGTLVASRVILKIPRQINKVIFCGIPLTSLSKEDLNEIKESINLLKTKFIGFQNEDDPHGNYDQVRDFGNIVPKKASNHEYPYFSDFQKFLNS